MHKAGPQTHEQKEAAFARLFGGVGADSTRVDDTHYQKETDFSTLPSAPLKDDVVSIPIVHRPDPKLSDDVKREPYVATRTHAGTELSSKESNFVKLFDHESRDYAQAAAVENVDMSKLPDHYEPEKWAEAQTKTGARGTEELKDSAVREQWLPKGMEKKLSKRGEEMHENFNKLFAEPANRS